MGAGALALTISTIIACLWPESNPDGIYTLGLVRRQPYALPVYIWLFCIFWWIVQDALKVFTFYIVKKYNFFEYNDTGKVVLPESSLKYIETNKSHDMLIEHKGKSHH